VLADQEVVPSGIQITAQSASVLVTAIIAMNDATDANIAMTTMRGYSKEQLSFFLGVTVETVERLDLVDPSGEIVVQGPTLTQRLEPAGEDSENIGLVVGLVVAVAILSAASTFVGWKIVKSRAPPKGATVQAVHVHDVSVSTIAPSGPALADSRDVFDVEVEVLEKPPSR